MDRRSFVGGVGAAALLAAMPKIALAKAAADEIAKLGTTLTPMGAIKEGNADGSIAPWSGKWLGTPPGISFAGTGSPLSRSKTAASSAVISATPCRDRLTARASVPSSLQPSWGAQTVAGP